MRSEHVNRVTKETNIDCKISTNGSGKVDIDTSLPFFDHMLKAMLFHGGFDATIKATGDIDVDAHHLIEDCGIVIGETLRKIFEQDGKIVRYGQQLIPMDDALCLAVVDFCNRPYLAYNMIFPQTYCGELDTALFKEFFYALAMNAKINLHLLTKYGDNSHHIIEAAFKATGKSLAQALTLAGGDKVLSTKGSL